jgi:hypothetical protein
MVDVLCRLNREIAILQKQRDDSRRTLGSAHDPARIKDTDERSAIDHERFYSNPPAGSKLDKPASAPLLPPVPTSDLLADDDEAAVMAKRIEQQEHFLSTLQRFCGKKAPVTTAPESLPLAAPAGQASQPPPENGTPANANPPLTAGLPTLP